MGSWIRVGVARANGVPGGGTQVLLALAADSTLALKTEAVVGIGKKAIKDVSAPGIDEDDQEGRLGMDAGHSRERFADESNRNVQVAENVQVADSGWDKEDSSREYVNEDVEQ